MAGAKCKSWGIENDFSRYKGTKPGGVIHLLLRSLELFLVCDEDDCKWES